MEIQALFPTLVGTIQADRATMEGIEREVVDKKEYLEGLLRMSWGDNVLTSFEAERNIFAAANLQVLKRFVEAGILEFVKNTRRDANLGIVEGYTQSWINITKKFGFQERHNHERSVEGIPISGAYYLRTNGNDGAFAVCPDDLRSKFFGNYEIQPSIGKLVLFRSEVFHRVGANLTDSDRISFSFNYLLR